MGTVAERQTKGRDAACTASRPLAYVCTQGAVSGSWSYLRVLVLVFSIAGVQLPRQRSCSYQP